mgnify:CR=1 FL=1|jgi:dephospho-CoA kinase
MKIIAIVGMCGSGKSTVSDMLVENGFEFIRLGQITLDIVKEKGLYPTEDNERPIRVEIRKKHGMAAYATLNFPKIDELLKKGNVVADGLYSWEEMLEFKNKYGDNFTTIGVVVNPKLRYLRLLKRPYNKDEDEKMRFRPSSEDKAFDRDKFDIENLNKAGPIAMADYVIVNEGSIEELKNKVKEFLKSFL